MNYVHITFYESVIWSLRKTETRIIENVLVNFSQIFCVQLVAEIHFFVSSSDTVFLLKENIDFFPDKTFSI
jgi:hypothetical protein